MCGIDYVDEMTPDSPMLFNLTAAYCTQIGGLITNVYKDDQMKMVARVYQKINDLHEEEIFQGGAKPPLNPPLYRWGLKGGEAPLGY
jgi:hypothetical protein